jgi:hypothetical protein
MDFLINGQVRRENQYLFLGTNNIIGIQSAEISPQLGISSLKYLGMGNNPFTPFPNSEQIGKIDLEAILINQDPFINLTGNILSNIYILRNPSDFTNNYSLLSGFLTNYTCKYQINQIPTISTSFSIANDMGNFTLSELNSSQQIEMINISNGTYLTGDYNVSNAGSISLNIGEFQTNRVQSYEIIINCNKTPIYNMGNKYPTRVQLITPLDVTCSFTFEVGDYQFIDKKNFPKFLKNTNLNLQINSAWTNIPITSYSFNNLNLIDETYNSNINNNLTSTVTYKTFA